MKKRFFGVIMSLVLIAAMLTGCAGSGSKSAAEQLDQQGVADIPVNNDQKTPAGTASDGNTAKGADLSERVDLVFYVMGDAPKDEELVEAALNEKLIEKCNATVDMQFSTWTEFQQKYANEITS